LRARKRKGNKFLMGKYFLPAAENEAHRFNERKERIKNKIGNRKSEIGNRKSEIGNRKSEIGNRKSEIGRESTEEFCHH
jgi:hypothetical protein